MNPIQLYQKAFYTNLSLAERTWMEEQMQAHPYFSVLHLVEAKNSLHEGRADAEHLRTIGAIYATDRQKFAEYMDQALKIKLPEVPPPPAESTDSDHASAKAIDEKEEPEVPVLPVSEAPAPQYPTLPLTTEQPATPTLPPVAEPKARAEAPGLLPDDAIKAENEPTQEIQPPAGTGKRTEEATELETARAMAQPAEVVPTGTGTEPPLPASELNTRLEDRLRQVLSGHQELGGQIRSQIRSHTTTTSRPETTAPAAGTPPAYPEPVSPAASAPATRKGEDHGSLDELQAQLEEFVEAKKQAAARTEEISHPAAPTRVPPILEGENSLKRFVPLEADPKPETLNAPTREAEAPAQPTTPEAIPAEPKPQQLPHTHPTEPIQTESFKRFVPLLPDPKPETLNAPQSRHEQPDMQGGSMEVPPIDVEPQEPLEESIPTEGLRTESFDRFVPLETESKFNQLPGAAENQVETAQEVLPTSQPAAAEILAVDAPVVESIAPEKQPAVEAAVLGTFRQQDSQPIPTDPLGKIVPITTESFARFIPLEADPKPATLNAPSQLPEEPQSDEATVRPEAQSATTPTATPPEPLPAAQQATPTRPTTHETDGGILDLILGMASEFQTEYDAPKPKEAPEAATHLPSSVAEPTPTPAVVVPEAHPQKTEAALPQAEPAAAKEEAAEVHTPAPTETRQQTASVPAQDTALDARLKTFRENLDKIKTKTTANPTHITLESIQEKYLNSVVQSFGEGSGSTPATPPPATPAEAQQPDAEAEMPTATDIPQSKKIDQMLERLGSFHPKPGPGEDEYLDEASLQNRAAQAEARPTTYATETLARVHVQQGNVETAIEIYEKLKLLYPEKSAYFEAEISKLK
ncbi:MAG: hypothetical protein LW884_03040 [Bacteroidetes bacterium]|nr:hypothetical protein [Bacteroidota bacterium]